MSNLTAVVHWQGAALCNSFILRSILPFLTRLQRPVKRAILSVCFIATMVVGKSQERSYGIGGHQFIGEVGVVQDDAYTPYSNASITALNPSIKFGLAASSHYSIVEDYSLSGQLPTFNGSLSVVLQKFGNESYSELSERLSFAKKIYDDFAFALGLEHINATTLESTQSILYPLVSTSLLLDENILLGFQTKNPFNQSWSQSDRLNARSYYAIGLAYKDKYNYQISAQLAMEDEEGPTFALGSKIPFHKKFGISLGIRTQPAKYSSGLWVAPLDENNVKAGIGTSISPHLGLSPGAWIAYQ